MKQYTVSGQITISVYTTGIRAKNKADAIEQAQERGNMGLCYHCCKANSDIQWVTSGSLDGDAVELEAEAE